MEFINTSEGKVVSGSTAFDYVYNLKDHLGNVRVSFSKDATGNAEIVQQDHYYPFGMRMANLSENDGNDNNYLYNNKEFENDHDLSWYHYGARYYDPQICRWLQVDPADEFFSAYVYCGNNPVNFVDPDGKEFIHAKTNSESYRADFTLAIDHLIENDPRFLDVWVAVNKPGVDDIVIWESTKHDVFIAEYRVLHWCSTQGNILKSGERQSPATKLHHEFGHIQQLLELGLDEFVDYIKDDGSKYTSPGEEDVIKNWETPYVKSIGEGVRDDHDISGRFNAISPVSTQGEEIKE